jgi:perosamine synthetase
MIPLSKPYFDSNETDAAKEVIESGWVTQGPKVQEFEKLICEYTGAKYTVAVTNCTSALFMCLSSFEIGKNDIVLCPSLSFIATANSIILNGAEPFFMDIDPNTLNINEKIVEDEILKFFDYDGNHLTLKTNKQKKLRCIIGVHQVGNPLNISELVKLKEKYKIHIIEDAACALGSTYNKNGSELYVGNTELDAACFSLHPRKIISCGEGGFITTNDEDLYSKLRALRHHGMTVSDLDRHISKVFTKEEYNSVGFNYRLSDINAAIAIKQLNKLDKILSKYKKNFLLYSKHLTEIDEISLIPGNLYGTANYQSIVARCNHDSIELINYLKKNNVSAKKGVMAIHQERPYLKSLQTNLSNTEACQVSDIILPNFYELTEKEIVFISNSIKNFYE